MTCFHFRSAVVLVVVALTACDNHNPAEVRTQASTFPLRATWSASAAPVGTGTVRATLGLKQFEGFHMDAAMSVTGAPGASYQWRIFRGDCATNTAAVNNTAPTGLILFATIQSYPDVIANTSGTGSISPTIAGTLDSLGKYSVRVRVATSATNWNGTNPVSCGNLQRTAGG